MSRKLTALLLAMLVLAGAMSLKTVIADSHSGSVIAGNGSAPLPPPIARNGSAPLPPPTFRNGSAPLPPPMFRNGSAPLPPPIAQ